MLVNRHGTWAEQFVANGDLWYEDVALLLTGEKAVYRDLSRWRHPIQLIGSPGFSSDSRVGQFSYNLSSGSLQIPANPQAFEMGTQDWTLEFWFKPMGSFINNLGKMVGWSGANAFGVGQSVTASTRSLHVFLDNTRISPQTTYVLPFNQWHHIAIVGRLDRIRGFVNGVRFGLESIGLPNTSNISNLLIGNLGVTSYLMDNLRLTIGKARYWSDFTPSVLPYYPRGSVAAANEVKLLFNFEGAVGTTIVADQSAYGKIYEHTSGTTFVNTRSKFGSTSLQVSGGRLLIGDKSGWRLENRDWTFESWINVGSRINRMLFGDYLAGLGGVNFTLNLNATNGQFVVDFSSGSSNVSINSGLWDTNLIALDTWHHVAICRQGSTFMFYIDGVKVGEATSSVSIGRSKTPIYIGNFTASYWVDSLKFTIGTCLYTANFTPPTVPFS